MFAFTSFQRALQKNDEMCRVKQALDGIRGAMESITPLKRIQEENIFVLQACLEGFEELSKVWFLFRHYICKFGEFQRERRKLKLRLSTHENTNYAHSSKDWKYKKNSDQNSIFPAQTYLTQSGNVKNTKNVNRNQN